MRTTSNESDRVSEKEEGEGISLRSIPMPVPVAERVVESVGLGRWLSCGCSSLESASSIIREGVRR